MTSYRFAPTASKRSPLDRSRRRKRRCGPSARQQRMACGMTSTASACAAPWRAAMMARTPTPQPEIQHLARQRGIVTTAAQDAAGERGLEHLVAGFQLYRDGRRSDIVIVLGRGQCIHRPPRTVSRFNFIFGYRRSQGHCGECADSGKREEKAAPAKQRWDDIGVAVAAGPGGHCGTAGHFFLSYAPASAFIIPRKTGSVNKRLSQGRGDVAGHENEVAGAAGEDEQVPQVMGAEAARPQVGGGRRRRPPFRAYK